MSSIELNIDIGRHLVFLPKYVTVYLTEVLTLVPLVISHLHSVLLSSLRSVVVRELVQCLGENEI